LGVIVPLATGIITDTLAGSARPFEQVARGATDLGALNRLSNLIPHYQPSSRGTLSFYCLIIVACIGLKGLMSFLTRWVLIGVSRDIEFDIRSDLLDRLLVIGAGVLCAQSNGRADVARDERLERGAHGAGTGDHVHGNHGRDDGSVDRHPGGHFAFADAVGIAAGTDCGVCGAAFRKSDSRALRKDSSFAGDLSAKVQENLSGVRVIRAYARKRRRFADSTSRTASTWRKHAIDKDVEHVHAIVDGADRDNVPDRAVAGRLPVSAWTMSLGALITFNTYLGLLVWPMIALGWVTNIFQRGAASMGRLNYILTAKPQMMTARQRSARRRVSRND